MSTRPAATDPTAEPGADDAIGREPGLARSIAARMAASRTRRVALADVLAAAAAVDRTAAAAVGWRARVAAALEDLRDLGRIEWPKGRFDHAGSPPLPAWVARPRLPQPPRPTRREPAWRHELSWAVDAGLSDADVDLLAAVNEWLGHAGALIVPLRERSLEVFGDEKLLEALLLGPLFTPGRLSLEVLRAESCWPEVVQTVTDDGDDWLVVENYTTYVSLSRAALVSRFPSRVVWGSGNQVGTRLAALAVSGLRPRRAWYFGDVDTGGFKVASSAVNRAAELGLGIVAPARGLYHLALERGRRRPTRSAPAGQRAQSWIRSWLGGELGPVCAEIAGAGDRIVQEHVGTAALSGVDLRILLDA